MVLAGDIAVFLTFIFSALFCILYGFFAKWWTTEFGIHIWTFTLMYAVLFGWFSWAVLTRDYPPPPEQWLGRFIFIGMQAAFMGWRLSLLIRMQIVRKRISQPDD